MPHHRSLSIKVFLEAVSPEFIQRYSDQLEVEQRPSGWATMNAAAMQQFLDDPENAEASASIREDFRRINDLCGRGMSLVTRAYNLYDIPLPEDRPAQELAIRLFLNHRDAFDYAWSRYLLLQGSKSKLTFYHVDAPKVTVQASQVKALESDLAEWFKSLAKGSICTVQHFEDQAAHVFRVSRGSYLRTVAHWQRQRIIFTGFRPASEDLLVFDPKRQELTIKASLAKDRDHYLTAFATHIARDEGLVEAAKATPMLTLLPFQSGTFDFSGNGEIISIQVVGIQMKLRAKGAPTFALHSEDVLDTLRQHFGRLGLDSGELTSIQLCFEVHPEGERPERISVDLEPPSKTDLAQKRYREIIEPYLMEQKVKLL